MKRVLVVEDHPEIRALLTQLLRDAGYAVVDAWTFVEAKAKLAEGRFDLLISDVLIPGGGLGTDLAEIAVSSGVKYLLVTGHPAEMRVLDERKQPYIAKPFRAAEFFERINSVWNTETSPHER
ncbi:MAG TPA: response regulator [Stellaceae bacterium]|nr:response regulator [Stellaceae bacterium]